MYRVEIIFRFNQTNDVPDCLQDVHRVANTDYFEILAATFSEEDFAEVHTFLVEAEKDRELVSYFFETLEREKRKRA